MSLKIYCHVRNFEDINGSFDKLRKLHNDALNGETVNVITMMHMIRFCICESIDRFKPIETGLVKDMISIITSFCCRLYGLRRGNNKANKIKKERNY